MKPYTYLLEHIPTGTYYYGVRYQNVKKKIPIAEDLWTKYFTSSPKVKELIKEYGTDSFEFEIRKEFDTPKAATDWETKVLRRCKVLHDNKWINQNIAGHIVLNDESCKKISDFHKGKPKSAEHRRKMSEAKKGIPKDPKMFNDEYRANMSKIKSGKGNGMYGRKHSEETLAKIRAGRKGQPAHNKGKPMSEEQKEKIRETLRRKKEQKA